ncbi:MAG: hypothetical protein HGA38_00105 [Candidatus Moranbacteria bacterium]|nr:hypothetical protein [Candidatus Moranbacteria bacterium]NTW45942.1 hypothetical protein [Candidatus Moranbacteria bacterium]
MPLTATRTGNPVASLAEHLISAYVDAVGSRDLSRVIGLFRNDARLISTLIPRKHDGLTQIRNFYEVYFGIIQKTEVIEFLDSVVFMEDDWGGPSVVSIMFCFKATVPGLLKNTRDNDPEAEPFCTLYTDLTLTFSREKNGNEWKIAQYQETRRSLHHQ